MIIFLNKAQKKINKLKKHFFCYSKTFGANTKRIAKLILYFLCILIVSYSLYQITFYGRIFPNTFVLGINLGGKNPQQATIDLSEKLSTPEDMTLTNSDQTFIIPLSDINLSYDFNKTADNAFNNIRKKKIFDYLFHSVLILFKPEEISIVYKYDQELLTEKINSISNEIDVEPVFSEVTVQGGTINITESKSGVRVDQDQLLIEIIDSFTRVNFKSLPIPIKNIDVNLDQEQSIKIIERANKLLKYNLVIVHEDKVFEYRGSDLIGLIDPYGDWNKGKIKELVDIVSENIDRQPQNPVFNFQNGRVIEFSPSLDGLRVNKDDLLGRILDALYEMENTDTLEKTIEVPVAISPPDYITSDVNNMGINELIGKGTSYYRGSISSRIHNISISSSRFNGVLVPPGETMSFNKILGDVSKETGYQQAYIIKDGATVLGDGGGVCQVSTTLFRAALDAGLPIVERRAHAYRVSYYEQSFPVGLDATVYDPSPDLKIKNDTPGHILIQTINYPKSNYLVFEIYGTHDGRVSSTTKPIVSDSTPPPEDLYIDDPTLPAGEIKQIDWKAWGAKVRFTYTVTRNGEVLFEKTFYSNYQPWQAKHLRGTGPVQ